jgi:hypothetical protein
MTQTWIALLVVVGIVLLVDLVTTQLRRRARRTSDPIEPSPIETKSEGRANEGVTHDHN